MKTPYCNIKQAIGAAAIATLVYLSSVLIGLAFPIVLSLLLVAFGFNVWMAIRILKDPYTTDKTFDEYFYQDRDDLRRMKEN